MVGLHLVDLEMLLAGGADSVLLLVERALVAVGKGADAQVLLVPREQELIDSLLLRHLVISHEFGCFRFQGGGIEAVPFVGVVEESPFDALHFLPVLREGGFDPIDDHLEIEP